MSENVARRARLIGLVSAVVAIVVIGVLLLSGLGFDSFTRLQQLSLLLAVAVLWAVHMPLHFGGRYWSRRLAATRKTTWSFKNRKL
jgi:hypothetical protein